METAKIVDNGEFQTVILPKSCCFDSEEVFVHRAGNVVMLFQKKDFPDSLAAGMGMFTDDYLKDGIDDLSVN